MVEIPPPPPPQMHIKNRPFRPPRPLPFYPPPNRPLHFMPPPPPPPHFYQTSHHQPLHHTAHFPPLAPPSPVFNRPPSRSTPSPSISPSPPPQLSNPPAPPAAPAKTAGTAAAPGKQDKLDKLLEKLGTRFPECSKAHLTSLLQQVKSSRGTLAGMCMEEVVVQVGLQLAKNEACRRLCLMCQNLVDPVQRHPLGCSHTVHKDCIRTWLETSKNNSCPFCK